MTQARTQNSDVEVQNEILQAENARLREQLQARAMQRESK
jgi:hypothetical protein